MTKKFASDNFFKGRKVNVVDGKSDSKETLSKEDAKRADGVSENSDLTKKREYREKAQSVKDNSKAEELISKINPTKDAARNLLTKLRNGTAKEEEGQKMIETLNAMIDDLKQEAAMRREIKESKSQSYATKQYDLAKFRNDFFKQFNKIMENHKQQPESTTKNPDAEIEKNPKKNPIEEPDSEKQDLELYAAKKEELQKINKHLTDKNNHPVNENDLTTYFEKTEKTREEIATLNLSAEQKAELEKLCQVNFDLIQALRSDIDKRNKQDTRNNIDDSKDPKTENAMEKLVKENYAQLEKTQNRISEMIQNKTPNQMTEKELEQLADLKAQRKELLYDTTIIGLNESMFTSVRNIFNYPDGEGPTTEEMVRMNFNLNYLSKTLEELRKLYGEKGQMVETVRAAVEERPEKQTEARNESEDRKETNATPAQALGASAQPKSGDQTGKTPVIKISAVPADTPPKVGTWSKIKGWLGSAYNTLMSIGRSKPQNQKAASPTNDSFEKESEGYEKKPAAELITAELERLLQAGADPNFVTRSLAGVGTPESLDLRERLLKAGADPNAVALSFVGVGKPESIEWRKRLLKAGADKDTVARSLAGVTSEAGFEFRKKFFGDDPTLAARSFSTNSVIFDGVVCRYGYEGTNEKESEQPTQSPETSSKKIELSKQQLRQMQEYFKNDFFEHYFSREAENRARLAKTGPAAGRLKAFEHILDQEIRKGRGGNKFMEYLKDKGKGYIQRDDTMFKVFASILGSNEIENFTLQDIQDIIQDKAAIKQDE